MTIQATEALVGLSGLVLLAALVYGPWQWACTDFARQILFEKRDEIFDLAADERLNFNSDEYRTIRRSIETSIRFAHTLTLPHFIFMLVTRRKEISHGPSGLTLKVEKITDDATRKLVKRKVLEVNIALVGMMVAKSPVTLVLAVLPLIILGASAHFVGRCRDVARMILIWCGELIQVEAESSDALPIRRLKSHLFR